MFYNSKISKIQIFYIKVFPNWHPGLRTHYKIIRVVEGTELHEDTTTSSKQQKLIDGFLITFS